MEDGSNGILPDTDEKIQNGVVSPIVANFPTTTTTTTATEDATISAIIEAKINDDLTITKINGDRNVDKIDQIGDDYDCNSSDASDALVIDESIPKQQKTKRKRNKKSIKPTNFSNENTDQSHYNPYFNESLFELSQQHLTTATGTVLTTTTTTTTAATISPIELTTINSVGVYDKTDNCGQKQQQTNLNKSHKHKRLKKSSPKLREYTQYLGLQPSLQFKCSKCTRTGFQSLNLLNEHLVQCNAEPILQQPTTNDNNQALSSSFKLTRKVFLCSACGTYYENWNLYLHMIEVHRRYLCLYCLGMFSVLDDLCTHIQIKHNLEPGYKENLQEFFNTYSDPCYIVCCNCGKLFNEQENFFYHSCTNIETTNNNRVGKSINKTKQSPTIKQNEQHITGDSIINQPPQQIDEIKLDDAINNEISTTNQEILYSSDSDADLKGFDGNGEAVVSDRTKIEEKIDEPIIEQHQQQHQEDDEQGDDEASEESGNDEEIEEIETRKVPKLSLKLKLGSYPEIEQHSDHDDDEDEDVDENQENSNDDEDDDKDSDKDECDENEEQSEIVDNCDEEVEKVEEIQIAGSEIPIIELQLEQPLDKFDIRLLLQKCLNATAPTCIYCNHARKINVNGKRLGLHAIAQHRYSAIVSSITAEELIPESFVTRIKENLTNLDSIYFNLESNPTQIDGGVTFSHIFECFQCRYSTTIHKELYLHNRKSHTKNLLLCIMCKLNFYSYSELICHLCPGAYIIDYDVQFRCCMCVSDDIPSAFRLMVHLRKRHHCCDVCLEMCHNQYKLSNHVWKHKLHHFCYRCGIAYRNKPDITRHLFWKHGTESVVCKKCLQKKWPHVYHFCVPPNHFQCDECNLTLTRAVALKVHKRIHTNEKPHSCTIDDCQERFISKKLLAKHELRHREPPPLPPPQPPEETPQIVQQKDEEDDEEIRVDDEINDKQENKDVKVDEEKEKPIQKPKIDVYDLPELNLSESDSSESDVETDKKTNDNNGANIEKIVENPIVDNNSEDGENRETVVENCNNDNEIPILEETNDDTNINHQDVVIENIWDNFKNYQANKEKFDHLLTEVESKLDQQNDQHEQPEQQQDNKIEEPLTLEMALLDHDYCIDPDNKPDISFTEVKPDLTQSVDHDYCFGKSSNTTQDKNDDDDKVDNNETKVEKIIETTVKIDENNKNSPQKQSNSSTSDSSSDSDSSSCSCGPNCSCSSSSDSSSSSSDSSDSDSSTEEGRKRQQLRRDKRRQRANTKRNNKIDTKKDDNKIVDIISTATTTTTAATTNTNLLLSEISIHESDLETTESETDEEFYDKQPHLMAKKILEEKRNQLLAGIEAITTPNGSLLEQPSRSTTPNLPVDVEQQQQQQQEDEATVVRSKKKSKSKKKKKKKKSENSKEMNIPNTNFYQYYQTAGSVVLNSPIQSPNSPSTISLKNHYEQQRGSDDDASLRASKRRRVPNKFYGYSSDEDEPTKWRKTDLSQMPQQQQTPPPQPQQFVVPPITIKTQGTQPFSVSKSTPNQMKFHTKQQFQQQQQQQQRMPPIRLKQPKNHHKFDDNGGGGGESEQESTDSASGESRNLLKVNPSALYCYCKCPYDEVSEMIGCDAPDCKIEWFHFECVGIMVPPKGHWYCPECRKKRQQKREALKLKSKQQSPA